MQDEHFAVVNSGALAPQDLARRTFATVRKGFDPREVREVLERAASELERSIEREAELRKRLADAERRAAHPVLDESTLTSVLGEETARVLASAHQAAADVRARAEENAARVLREAHEQAAEVTARAESVLARRSEEAEEAAADILERGQAEAAAKVAAAVAESERRLKAAAEDAERVTSEARREAEAAVGEAQQMRGRVLGDLVRRRRALRLQVERLRAARESLLETVRAARATFSELEEGLQRAEVDARAAADTAARRAAAEPGQEVEDLDQALVVARETDLLASPVSDAADHPSPSPALPSLPGSSQMSPAPDLPSAPRVASAASSSLEVRDAVVNPKVGRQDPGESPYRAHGEPGVVPSASALPPPARSGRQDGLSSPSPASDADAPGTVLHASDVWGDGSEGVRIIRPPTASSTDAEAGSPSVPGSAPSGPADAPAGSPSDPGSVPPSASSGPGSAFGSASSGPADAPAVPPSDPGSASSGPADAPAGALEGIDQLFARLRAEQDGAAVPDTLLAEGDSGAAGSKDGIREPVPPIEEPGPTSLGPARAERPGHAAPGVETGAASGPINAEQWFQRRDERIEPLQAGLARKLKRALQDDQNELLDRVRNHRGRPDVALLEDHVTQRARYKKVALGFLARAAAAGASLISSASQPSAAEGAEGTHPASPSEEGPDNRPGAEGPDAVVTADDAGLRGAVPSSGAPLSAGGPPDGPGTMPAVELGLDAELEEEASKLADTLVNALRRRLEDVFGRVDGADEADLADMVGSAYRDWKGARIESLAGDHLNAAFAGGILAGAPAGTRLRWLVGDEGAPCPDCDDNALAGALLPGHAYPTGQPRPPAHSGCRCLLVPEQA